MSNSTVLCHSFIFCTRKKGICNSLYLRDSLKFEGPVRLDKKPRRVSRFVCNSSANSNSKWSHSGSDKSKSGSWWKRFFYDDYDANWVGLKGEDMLEPINSAEEEELSETERFEAWKRRAEAIMEIREAQQDLKNEEGKRWEDWLVEQETAWTQDDWVFNESSNSINTGNADSTLSDSEENGLVKFARYMVFGVRENDDIDATDILYEDRVFRYASLKSAKFLAMLIIIPCAMDFVVHDYVLMPFLDKYVRTVPLAAKILDVRRSQKLKMVDELKTERARYKLEVEIGKSPPLSNEEIGYELRHKALELRDEWRLENRRVFANIWSDMIFGITLFLLLYLNQNKVALLKFTGYRIISNISDGGKSFLILVVADILLGYHSELGWETLLEIVIEHYGLEVDTSAITIFVCLVPVFIDSCVKLWLFKFLPRLSQNVAKIIEEMTRH